MGLCHDSMGRPQVADGNGLQHGDSGGQSTRGGPSARELGELLKLFTVKTLRCSETYNKALNFDLSVRRKQWKRLTDYPDWALTTLTLWLPWLRFFRAFSSVVRQMPGLNSQVGARSALFNSSWSLCCAIVFLLLLCCAVICVVLLLLCCSMYWLCVL